MDMASFEFEKEVIPNDPTPVRVLTSVGVSRLKERGRDEAIGNESEVIKLCS